MKEIRKSRKSKKVGNQKKQVNKNVENIKVAIGKSRNFERKGNQKKEEIRKIRKSKKLKIGKVRNKIQ